jgi:hypothetical protein
MQSGDQCFCAADNIANSAPTVREFSEQFNYDLSSLTSTLGSQYAAIMIQEETDGTAPVEPSRKECTVAADCTGQKGTLCVNNACLNEGNPRITLTWEGDDDLDLSIFTPDGARIWYQLDFDPRTGGSFDTLFSQDGFAPHAESVYFPTSGAPAGTYRIQVDSFQERGGSPDKWTIEVFTAAGGAVPVFVEQSTGNQDDILFKFGDVVESSTPDVCSTDNAQCCASDDCVSSGPFELRCVNRQCITVGRRAFTLSWTGSKFIDSFCIRKTVLLNLTKCALDDNYALRVLTPALDTIDFITTSDAISGGMFEADENEDVAEITFHTESVYFPLDSPTGEYVFFVDMITQNGVADEWRLEATEFGEEIFVETNSGGSQAFAFIAIQCKTDADCAASDICVWNRCLVNGTPRFTLTWEGDGDLYLSVEPPAGEVIDRENPEDEESGGVLQDDFDPNGSRHVESIYFDVGGDASLGEYRVRVETHEQHGESSDAWELTVTVGGNLVSSWNGTGDLDFKWPENGQDSSGQPDPTGTQNAGTDAPTASPSSESITICFSGDTTVITEDRGEILMKDLQLGDRVATSANSFEPVYSFGHRKDSLEAIFIQLLPSMLEVSADHMVFVQGGRAVPASSLQVGDQLFSTDVVTSIQYVTRTGVYAPFTPSGFLLVNNVKVSSYVAFQKSEFLKIGDVKTPLTYHWLAHTFQAPHRLWCSITSCLKETYTDAGVSTWVDLPLQFTKWWLAQNAVLMVLVLVPLALSLVAMSCLDFFITTYPFTTAIGLLGLWFLRKPAAMVAS